jgi:hypothetical protein
MLTLIKNKPLINERLKALTQSIQNAHVYLPKDETKFVFLCGANKAENEISERRKALIAFSTKYLPHTQFLLAEKIFATLMDEGHKGNILDIEHDISKFADHILIILESFSAFTELGAFSHDELRSKLIVINDSKYIDSSSFINLGPLQAIKEKSGSNSVIHYKMSMDGVHKLDAIGDTYSALYELLKEPLKSKSEPLKLEQCNPAIHFDKLSAMFVHDLIYFTGPLLYKELIEILIQIFGKADFKLKNHVAILKAFGSIDRNPEGLFKSLRRDSYYSYKFDVAKLIATFRNFTLKYYPERIYEY